MAYTAQEVADMAHHIRNCQNCGAGDPDIVGDTYAEDLPPEELASYIASSHRFDAHLRNTVSGSPF
ncbi:hypothetical protein ACIBKY_51590 [Nonomuraea sp. NPDC050394]|uniref:hypothetical protein n=1 Tax=Nonomuraea sp. NPDC050394 TaxID=3364363 RepID=UPI0037B26BC3